MQGFGMQQPNQLDTLFQQLAGQGQNRSTQLQQLMAQMQQPKQQQQSGGGLGGLADIAKIAMMFI